MDKGNSPKGAEANNPNSDLAVTKGFSMAGAFHTLTLSPGPAAKVLMASNDPGSLSAKIIAAIAKLNQQENKEEAAKRIADLEPIKLKAESVENLMKKANLSEQEKKGMNDKGTEIASALTAYGKKYSAKDILEFNVYPGPKVGSYSSLGDLKPLPDGTTRESHHAPPVELGNALAKAITVAGADIEEEVGPESAESLSMAADNLNKALRSHGSDLPAILMHTNTHRRGGRGGTRVHGSEIREQLKQQLAGTPSWKLITTVKSQGEALSVRPGAPAYERQLSSVAEQIVGSKQSLREAMKKHARQIIASAYDGAASQTLIAVDIALKASVLDGTSEQRSAAMKELYQQADEKWKRNIYRIITQLKFAQKILNLFLNAHFVPCPLKSNTQMFPLIGNSKFVSKNNFFYGSLFSCTGIVSSSIRYMSVSEYRIFRGDSLCSGKMGRAIIGKRIKSKCLSSLPKFGLIMF